MQHRDLQPGTDCPGCLKLIRILDGYSGRLRMYRCQQCNWTNRPKQKQQQQIGQSTMKLRLQVNRKAGAPGYGSDGASAELELELDPETSLEAIVSTIAPAWYKALEQTVGAQIDKMQAAHPALAAPQNPRSAIPDRQSPPPAAPPLDRPIPPQWDPRNRQPQPDSPATRHSPLATVQDYRDQPPRTGKQLLGWAYGHRQAAPLKQLAREIDRGPINTWSEDLVAWAYQELTRPQPAGQWGGSPAGQN
jgi:hypothetical protein